MDDQLIAAVERITAKVSRMLPPDVTLDGVEAFRRGKHQCIGVTVIRAGIVRATTEYWGAV